MRSSKMLDLEWTMMSEPTEWSIDRPEPPEGVAERSRQTMRRAHGPWFIWSNQLGEWPVVITRMSGPSGSASRRASASVITAR
jgi:hypothetical protein